MSRPDSVVVILPTNTTTDVHGLLSVDDARDALNIEDALFVGFLRGRLRKIALTLAQAVSAAKRGMALSLRGQTPAMAKSSLQKWLAENVDNVRTPLTVENVEAWAVKAAAGDNGPRAVEEKLTDLLMALAYFSHAEEKASDLRETILDLFRSGVKGYDTMTKAELLEDIQNEFIEGLFQDETIDLEDAFERLDFYQDEEGEEGEEDEDAD